MNSEEPTIADPEQILAFWRAAGRAKWFKREDAFDAEIRAQFLASYEAAASGKLDAWQSTPEGTLALLLLLDQFPRNLFRGEPRAFATDAAARAVAERAIAKGTDRLFPTEERAFFYMPLMHSENLADQERCIVLFREAEHAEGIAYAELHAEVIRRFGRFPHRNAALGRASTEEERAFLEAGGGFG